MKTRTFIARRICQQLPRACILAATLSTCVMSAHAAQTSDKAPVSAVLQQQSLEKVLHAAKDASWIAEGNGSRLIYIFFDPNCPYCHKLYEETRPWIGREQIQLRWIPVGVLMPSSAGKAAAILEAKNPLAAFHENESTFGTMARFGAIAESLPTPQTVKRLAQNADLLKQTRRPGVPVMLFRERSGGLRVVDGAPSSQQLLEIMRSVK